MKQLLFILAISLFSQFSQAEFAQILRAKLHPAHFEKGLFFQGGVIELQDNVIKLSVNLRKINSLPETKSYTFKPMTSEVKQVDFIFDVTSVETDECGAKIYSAIDTNSTTVTEVTVYDYQNANACDDIHLYPVTLDYTTLPEGGEFTSSFDASKFETMNKGDIQSKLGLSNPKIQMIKFNDNSKDKNQDPVILPVVDLI